MLAIIGGTGMTQLANLEITHRQVIRTPYGEPSGALTFGRIKDHNVVFLARHGYGHTIPPHEINYRANIWALASQHVSRIVAVASVGGIRSDLGPGKLILPNQLIDYTYGRKFTFFEGGEKPVTHIDFTEPYCPKLRKRVLKAAKLAKIELLDGGVYALACEQGISYASIAVVANHAAGRGDSKQHVDINSVGPILDDAMMRVRTILEYVVEADGD